MSLKAQGSDRIGAEMAYLIDSIGRPVNPFVLHDPIEGNPAISNADFHPEMGVEGVGWMKMFKEPYIAEPDRATVFAASLMVKCQCGEIILLERSDMTYSHGFLAACPECHRIYTGDVWLRIREQNEQQDD